MFDSPKKHVLGIWEETGVSAKTLTNTGKTHKLHREIPMMRYYKEYIQLLVQIGAQI